MYGYNLQLVHPCCHAVYHYLIFTAGDDYLNHLSELTFTIGVEAYLAAIIIIDDGISEGEESFTLYLNVSGRSVQLNPASATVFIADSSGEFVITILDNNVRRIL